MPSWQLPVVPAGLFVSRISTQDVVLGLEFLHFLKRQPPEPTRVS
jgi:hypothetical protein